MRLAAATYCLNIPFGGFSFSERPRPSALLRARIAGRPQLACLGAALAQPLDRIEAIVVRGANEYGRRWILLYCSRRIRNGGRASLLSLPILSTCVAD